MKEQSGNNLKMLLQQRLYNHRVEVNDLTWAQVSAQVDVPKPTADLVKWISAAASFLILITAGFYYANTQNSIIPDVQSAQNDPGKISNPDQSNEEVILPVLQEQEHENSIPGKGVLEKDPPFKSGTAAAAVDSIKGNEMLREQPMVVKKMLAAPAVNVEPGTPYFISEPVLAYTETDWEPPQNVISPKRSFNFQSYSLSIRPVQKYSSITPNRSDYIYLTSMNVPGSIDQNRFGLNSSLDAGFETNTGLQVIFGVSYLFQKNDFSYEYRNQFTQNSSSVYISENSHHLGLKAGVQKKLPGRLVPNSALQVNLSFLKSLSNSEYMPEEMASVEAGYSVGLARINGNELRIKPMISYSFSRNSNADFDSKPYWVGLEFTLQRWMKSRE